MHSVREAIARSSAESVAGGMSEGLRKVGFRSVWANDFNEDAARGSHVSDADAL